MESGLASPGGSRSPSETELMKTAQATEKQGGADD
jgi:hypothetical protein